MWILESNGDFLQGKRMWLKPGQKYLFGRVKREGVRFAIDHKTVSRKHFIIEVDAVKEGDVGQVHARTRVRIEDQNSKSGTSVNGELIKNTSKELKNAENSIRPGTCPHEIIITWHPCVLTFNLLKKEIKSGVLKTKQARVQHLDIKAIGDFSSEHTTHVVANKRNTAKGLLALVTGKYLVAESFIDALEYKATPTNLSQEENLSLLELDFDRAWPEPKDHLPPPGREPSIRPAESYEPDPSRINVFQGHTFVFGDQTQFDNLLPVVTGGHGKALLFKVVNGETTSNELLQFLQNAAGHKHGGDIQNGARGGVILVRWQSKGDIQAWTETLIDESSLKMDQRAIDQSEFLDAILANDATLLQRTIPFERTNEGRHSPPPSAAISLATRQPHEAQSNNNPDPQRGESVQYQGAPPSSSTSKAVANTVPSQASSPNVSQARTNGQNTPRPFQRPRFTQASRFKDFDDGFDPDAIAAYDDEYVGDAQFYEPEPEIKTLEEPMSTSKKRPRPESEEPVNEFAEQMDDLLPAATRLKRQKLAEGRPNGQTDDSSTTGMQPVPKKKKKEREIDVRQVVRAQREEKEEAARREEEILEAASGYYSEDQGPANLVDVVVTELPRRDKTKNLNKANGEHGDHWDPKWNGRKNFKSFRRKGEAPQRRGHARKVIVPLVEVPENTYGLGERYWEKTEEEKERERERKRKEGARSQKMQNQTQRSSGTASARSRAVIDDDEDEDFPVDDVTKANDDFVSTSLGISRLQREAAEIVDHEIDPDTPRRTRGTVRSEAASHRPSQTQTSSRSAAASTAKGKRTASPTSTMREPKRQKTLPVTVVKDTDIESDDSDDMKFRFGSRARKERTGAREKDIA
ncbi:uncharacterized protein Z518_10382 [Rhinocladiella mackenziei CBS 650.93]|uniref:FHA domain-containing protein n=1 Tax=Rhinocladiella mackenziei CBS 650.93 TaxID=1442369 RepID=A0A0D2GPF3_9EURO|nr:uncharacterized protein Z518_10382 [Rhinocladiella mackenziei CBS 650.93]KIX00243.1 hypothetical protein Z518_10382 [Rhinocladiella mackenziei CBS 650.93]